MSKKLVICLIGKSFSGRTKVADHIESEFGIKRVQTDKGVCDLDFSKLDDTTYTAFTTPDEFKNLKLFGENVKAVSIYLDVTPEMILERDKRKGMSEDDALELIRSQHEEYENYYSSDTYSYCVDTCQDIQFVYRNVDDFVDFIRKYKR